MNRAVKSAALGLFVCLLLVGQAAPATIHVPGDRATIQAAISAATAGDIIQVAAGTYVETGQIVINKNLSIVGEDRATTIIKPAQNTGSGDARGWFLVASGTTFNLSNVTLDGAGWQVEQAIRCYGGGTIDNNIFTNIVYPNYQGVAVQMVWADNPTVSNNVLSNIGRVGILAWGTEITDARIIGNTYTGKGPGDCLDVGVWIEAGAKAFIEGNSISDCHGYASGLNLNSVAIQVSTVHGAGTEAEIRGNVLTDNHCGVAVVAGSYGNSTVVAQHNHISGNTDWGLWSDGATVDARYNWWGDASGPQHASNSGGTGDPVTDYVLFDPWLGGENQISVAPLYEITNCSDPVTYTFSIERAGVSAEARGYEVKFDVDDAVVTVYTLASDIVEEDYLSSVGGTQFFASADGGGTYTVSCAILGGTTGATGNGDLFSVTLTPVAQGTSQISLVSVKLRDLDNQPLAVVAGVDAEVQVDCTPPTMKAILEAEGVWYNTAPTFSVFGFDDDVNLDLAEYQIDSGGWVTIFSDIDAAEWNDHGWALPGFGGLTEGSHTVYFRVKDDAGNSNGEGTPDTYSWQFYKDTEPPAHPTDFEALPGHEQVHLTWTNPSGDATFAGVEIRRVAWGDYPQYGTPGPGAPDYPADKSEGALVVKADLTAYDDPIVPRDIYYYAAFAYDLAGNYSVFHVDAADRSTNYWLGDIASPYNGYVDYLDLVPFSNAFGSIQGGGGGWNAEADFGPTDDWSRFGIPLPDDVVDFEDLMVLAMNYGKVSPLGSSGAGLLASSAAPLRDQVGFRVVLLSREGDVSTYALEMDNGASVLKGFSLKVFYGAGNELLEAVASSKLVGKGEEHFFGTIARETGVVEICVAALGVDTPMGYTGEVARVAVRERTPQGARISSVDLRDIANRRDEVTLPGGGGETPYVPAVTSLGQNHPNPFNPVTTIGYEVAEAGRVTIDIYDVSGRLVRRLVDENRGVGRHTASWDGRDGSGNGVHSGVYFYRMSAPGYTSSAKKMLLLK